jgi:hypothetical protein
MIIKYAEKPIPNPNEPINPFVEKWASFTERTQFFFGQLCVINIKNAETEVKKVGKKTKRTQLWITFPVR